MGVKCGLYFKILAFSDDLNRYKPAKTVRNISNLAEMFNKEANEVGLQVNEEITKMIYFGTQKINNRHKREIMDNSTIDYSDDLLIHGITLDNSNSEDEEVQTY